MVFGWMDGWMNEWKHYILINHILRNLELYHFINFLNWAYLKYFIINLNGTGCISKKSVSFLPQNSETTVTYLSIHNQITSPFFTNEILPYIQSYAIILN